MAAPSDMGGYDYQFVDTPSDMLICKICQFPSREPHLSTCCGHTYCKSCLDGARKATVITKACPVCRSEEFSTVANKQADRAVRSLLVFCANKGKGCEWRGEVNNILNHLRNSSGCQFEEISCPNDCAISVQRQHLTSHIEDKCVRRKVACQYCHITGEQRLVEGQHKDQCPKFPALCPNKCGTVRRCDMSEHMMVCPLEIVQCEYHGVGCDAKMTRQDQQKHDREQMEQHLLFVNHALAEMKHDLALTIKTTKSCTDDLTLKAEVTEKNQTKELVAVKREIEEMRNAFSVEFKQTEDDLVSAKKNIMAGHQDLENKLAASTKESCIMKGRIEAAEQESVLSKNNFAQKLIHIQNNVAANKATLENVGQSWSVCSYLIGICVLSSLVLLIALCFQYEGNRANTILTERMLHMETEIATFKQEQKIRTTDTNNELVQSLESSLQAAQIDLSSAKQELVFLKQELNATKQSVEITFTEKLNLSIDKVAQHLIHSLNLTQTGVNKELTALKQEVDDVKQNSQRNEDTFIQKCLNAVTSQVLINSENLTQLLLNMKNDLGSLQQQVAEVCVNLSNVAKMYEAISAELSTLETKLLHEIKMLKHRDIPLVNDTAHEQIKDIKEMLFNDWYRNISKKAQEFLSGDQIAPVIIKLPMLTTDGYSWSSSPFYTHKNGYRVNLLFIGEEVGSAESYDYQTTYLQRVKGRYDAELNCTFSGELEMTVLGTFSNNPKDAFATKFTYDCSNKHKLLLYFDEFYLLPTWTELYVQVKISLYHN